MTIHPFRAVSSPSCSKYALQKTANDYEEEYGSAVASRVHQNFYVDDCLRFVSTKVKAKEQIEGLRQICAKGRFCLTKFMCNQRSILESIPKEERSKDVKTLDLNYDELPIERALGVQWCVKSDTVRFRITIKDKPLTRRGILSMVSSTYDPLGLAAPSTFKAKKLLQDVYKDVKVGWGDKLPESYQNCWENWRNELPVLECILVPHCVKAIDFGEMKSREVHIFFDTSCVGYGSVAYLHLCDNEDRIHCSFLMGKARVAPIKAVTSPRLQLTSPPSPFPLGRSFRRN